MRTCEIFRGKISMGDGFTYPETTIHLAEFEPAKRTVTFGKKTYYLQFPWLLMMHTDYGHGGSDQHRDFSVGFMTGPLKSARQLIYMPWVPNVFEDCVMCLGVTAKSLEHGVRSFWTRRFDSPESGDWWGPAICPPHNWQKLDSLEKVVSAMRKTRPENRFDAFVRLPAHNEYSRDYANGIKYAFKDLKWSNTWPEKASKRGVGKVPS